MRPPRSRERLLIRVIACAGLVGLAWLAQQAIGWLGVGLIGLFTLFVAVRYEVEGNLPVGPQMTPDLYASSRTSRPAPRMGRPALRRPSRRWPGRLLALIGFGFFFMLEFGQ
jgi:hypothetical protein